MYAHALTAPCLLFSGACKRSLAHQRSTSMEESPLKTTSDWHDGNGSGPCRVQPPESAAQPQKKTGLAAAEFCQGCAQERCRVQATLPMESRSQADSEATHVKIDEDSSQDRDKGNSKEVANKLKDVVTLIRQLQPCAKDEGVAAKLEEKKQERDELKIQLQNRKPLHHRLRLATEARAKASKALEVAKREEADTAELLALKRAEVDQIKATLLQHNNNVKLLKLRYRTEAGNAEPRHFESPGVQMVAAPLSPVRWAAGASQLPQRRRAGRFRCLLQGARRVGGRRRDTRHSAAPAPETPPGHAGAFAPFP